MQGDTEEVEEKVEVNVPKVTGLSLTDAIKTLKENGFEVKINNEEEKTDKDNTYVKTQMPTAGVTAYQGSCVYLD